MLACLCGCARCGRDVCWNEEYETKTATCG